MCVQFGVGIQVTYRDQTGFTKWIAGLSHQQSSEAFMYCPKSCPSEEEDRIRVLDRFFFHKGRYRCCASQAVPFYNFYPYKDMVIRNVVFVEYFSFHGNAEFFYQGNLSKFQHQFLNVRHNNGYLTSIPENKCLFPNSLELDLSHNAIREIGNISCLSYLSVLNLHDNKISHVLAGTFDDLRFLWKVDLSFNHISWIEQYTLISPYLQLKDMHFENQRGTLSKVNISNLYPDRVFHILDFSNNCIAELVNCDDGQRYPGCYSNFSIQSVVDHKNDRRGGRIHLHENQCLKRFPDIARLLKTENNPSLLKLTKWYRYITFFDYQFQCSSEMFTLLNSVRYVVINNGFHVNCTDPTTGKIHNVTNLFHNNETDIFITHLNNSICPDLCECYSKPALETVFLNCSYRSLSANDIKRITKVWQYTNVSILLNNNDISSIEYFTKTFLKNVKLINLSYNKLDTMPRSFIQLLRNASSIDLRGNPITNVPKIVQRVFLKNCILKMNAVVPCTCSYMWLRDWLLNQDCGDEIEVTCKETGISILQSDSFENCEISNWYMYLTQACVIFPILLVISVHRFKVELYLLYRKFMNCQETQKQSYDYDIYICSGESSLELRKWLKSVFVPFFEGRRYRVIWPERDFLPGSMISEEVTTSVTKSANYVVFLSSAFCASHESEDSKMKMEWRQI